MTNESKRRATLPIDLAQALVPWLHNDAVRAIGCLRIEPNRLIATDGHRMVTIAPVDLKEPWCGRAFLVPKWLLVDAIAVARVPGRKGDVHDNIDRALQGKPPVDATLKSFVVEMPDEKNVRTIAAELEFSNGHKVRLTTNDPVDDVYPPVDTVMQDFMKVPGDRGASAMRFVSLNPSFLSDCHAIVKHIGGEVGMTLTGWSDDLRAPIFLQSVDPANRARFALMAMNVSVDEIAGNK